MVYKQQVGKDYKKAAYLIVNIPFTFKVTFNPNVLLLRYTVMQNMWIYVLSTVKCVCLDKYQDGKAF
jgi:hypothetical protein